MRSGVREQGGGGGEAVGVVGGIVQIGSPGTFFDSGGGGGGGEGREWVRELLDG